MKWDQKGTENWKGIKVLDLWLMGLPGGDRFICNHYDWHEIKGTDGWKEIKVLWDKWIYVKLVWLKWKQSIMDWNEI